jgi:Trypsin-like peptidase domain
MTNMNAIIRVGGGRGFMVEHDGRRYVVTASHCLTRPLEIRRTVDDENEAAVLPPPHPAMYTAERTYRDLLGSLDAECSVWAECLFVDPVADIAVLGQPDNQELSEHADAYDSLVDDPEPLPIGELPPASGKLQLPDGSVIATGQGEIGAQLLSLDRAWFSCQVDYREYGPLWITKAAQRIRGGMSGSPIVSETGAAVGLISVAWGKEGGPNPCLIHHLPGWLLRSR